jgi:predicted nucleic acid-binding protein
VILVVDASVAIKWFVREALHAEALRLLDHADSLHGPDLLAVEVTNVAWRKAARGEITRTQAAEIAKAIRQGTPLLYPSAPFIERALDLAFRLSHPVYDCLYLACAEAIDGTLITADIKFCARAQKAGFAARIESLCLGHPPPVTR